MLAAVDISAGVVSTADDVSSAPSRVVNFMPDVAGVQRPRPGLVAYATTGLGASPLIALYRWKTWLVGVTADRKIWALTDGLPTVWTALSDATAATQLDNVLTPVFAESPSFLYIAGGGLIQKWTGVGLTARLGGSSPPTSFIINIGQRLVAIDLTNPGRFLYSDLGEGNDATWGSLNFQTAESRPDGLVALYENTAEAALFGTSTLEIYGLSTDPLIPYQRINTLNIGLLAAYSVVRVDSFYFLLDDKRRIIKTDGRSYENASEAIQRDLQRLMTVSDCYGYRERTDRNDCLVFVFPTERRAWAMDMGSKKWAERGIYDGVSVNGTWDVAAAAYWDALNLNVCARTATLGLSYVDTDTRTDYGSTLLSELVTGWQDFGTANRKRSARLRVVMRRGTATLGATGGQLEIATQNDGLGWSGFKQIDVGQPSDLQQSKDLRVGGVFRRRRYWVRYSGSDELSIAGLYDDVEDLEATG